ncbi:mannose-6-phosphate isomerase, class I [Microbacterium indicum]|uniref:mannose-6-phosphate isomerase, class I n=1 Tax=Microbacterium indicum TaxID=358100 RepID=UPI00040FDEA4|nr:mannose-6-phosphate isomerase, class I [Microbacterium indicum]
MIVTLTNAPRDFSWGSRTLIAALEGRPASAGPEAEVWYGDHPSDPSDVGDGSGRTLDAFLADEHVDLGAAGRLPYLLKLLAAGESLSIQVHPTREQAREGRAREASLPEGAPRNYVDDNHKPEMVVALSDRFVALSGLRDLAATGRLLADIGSAAAPLADRIRDEESLGEAVRWLLSGEAQETVDAIVGALPDARSAEFAADLSNARANAETFPGDPGIIVGLLMNLVVLRRGEGLFLRAGQLHAYQGGLGVEVMAASDNVLRGGLTPKHVDADELMRILDRTAGPVPVVLPEAYDTGARGVDLYPADIADFRLLRAEVAGGGAASLPLAGHAIVLCVAGEVRVGGASGAVTIRPGQAAFASADEALLDLSGAGEVFVAQPGE